MAAHRSPGLSLVATRGSEGSQRSGHGDLGAHERSAATSGLRAQSEGGPGRDAQLGSSTPASPAEGRRTGRSTPDQRLPDRGQARDQHVDVRTTSGSPDDSTASVDSSSQRRPSLMARLLGSAVHGYQVVTASRPSPCRFVPSCSSYAAEALETHGAVKGTGLSVRRLCRCHPWGSSGWDPVPDASGQLAPHPTRSSATQLPPDDMRSDA